MTPDQSVDAATVIPVDSGKCAHSPDSADAVDVTVVASMLDDAGHRWLIVEERRLSMLLVDRDVPEGSDWILSPRSPR